MARIYSSSSEIMRVKGSAFGGLQVCGVEETLTTSVTSGGKAGVWRKEEERKEMREEKSWRSNVVIARSSSPFLFSSRWTKHSARQAIPRSKDPNNPNLFLDYSSIPSLLIERKHTIFLSIIEIGNCSFLLYESFTWFEKYTRGNCSSNLLDRESRNLWNYK